jgi:DNA polymerase III epsilon subunit-like protein
MKAAVIFDCEFLCIEGSLGRFWCGPQDPDPVVAQIGAVTLALEGAFALLDTYRVYVRLPDRFGKRFAIDPYFTELTSITAADIESKGIALDEALVGLDRFSAGARLWSWGKDELNMVAVSCYIAGLQPPIPAHRFDNITRLVVAAGMPVEDVAKMRSSRLADHYGVAHPPLQAHDALDDARSLAYALQHLLKTGKLQADTLSGG